MNQMRRVEIAARSVSGKRRTRNEDAIVINQWCSSPENSDMPATSFPVDKPLLLAVADGMGGHRAGDFASYFITRQLANINWVENFIPEITGTLNKLHRDLENLGDNLSELNGMGTTIAGVIIDNSSLHYFNIGDSRVYLLSDQSITQLSTDDSLFSSHIITQVLGGNPKTIGELNCHTGVIEFNANDTLLICSDGLSNQVSDSEIFSLCSGSVEFSVEMLIRLAMERGGHDNISVVVAKLT